MKKIFSIFAAALILFGAVSCKNKKDEPSAPKGAFAIEISNITDEGCAYTITPSNNTKEYMYMFLQADNLGNNLVKTVEAIMTFSRMTYSDYKNNGYIKQGPFGRDYSPFDLSSSTEYVLAVFHIDAELNVVGDVALSKSFYTLPEGYVDLGLPSGILWDYSNTGNSDDDTYLFTWEEASDTYGESLPTEEQYKELLENCSWSWSSYSNGYYVYGPNGNTIWFGSTGKYKIENESGAVVVNYDAEGENACCLWSISDYRALKLHMGMFLFFTQTDGPRMKSDRVTKRLAKVHLVAQNPNKK
ncbi:MAG: hypothetical protein J6T32_00570 [Paludibacteraceae bacterium]|nr:hypothetical protein [Paludibacteraceae bacterium]